jgi:hypothetical protein
MIWSRFSGRLGWRANSASRSNSAAVMSISAAAGIAQACVRRGRARRRRSARAVLRRPGRRGRGCAGHAAPAQHRAHTRQQFAQLEGLGHVVVGAELEADHAVDGVAGGGQHDQADLRVRLAQPARQRQAVLARHVDVEDRDVGLGRPPPARAPRRRRRPATRCSRCGRSTRSAGRAVRARRRPPSPPAARCLPAGRFIPTGGRASQGGWRAAKRWRAGRCSGFPKKLRQMVRCSPPQFQPDFSPAGRCFDCFSGARCQRLRARAEAAGTA